MAEGISSGVGEFVLARKWAMSDCKVAREMFGDGL